MNPLTVRLAERADLDIIMAIERECFDPEITFNRRQMRRFVVGGSVIVAVKVPDAVMGQITLWRRNHRSGNHLRIYNLAVATAHRKQGVGELLMKAGLQAFVDQKTTKVTLEVEVGSRVIDWYEKIGFYQKKLLKDYYGHNRDGIRMILPKPYPVELKAS